MERGVYDQVNSCFNDKNVLYEFRSGFRNGFSTDTFLVHLTDFIRSKIDQGNAVAWFY